MIVKNIFVACSLLSLTNLNSAGAWSRFSNTARSSMTQTSLPQQAVSITVNPEKAEAVVSAEQTKVEDLPKAISTTPIAPVTTDRPINALISPTRTTTPTSSTATSSGPSGSMMGTIPSNTPPSTAAPTMPTMPTFLSTQATSSTSTPATSTMPTMPTFSSTQATSSTSTPATSTMPTMPTF